MLGHRSMKTHGEAEVTFLVFLISEVATFGGLVVRVLAIGSKVRDFKPNR
jgi:heme/copper-type cytochrome/quinol oxidase subunit 3